jgi:Zn finger protein HypA/HybF involved in hydrogenase expression
MKYNINLFFCLFALHSFGQGLKHSHHDFTGDSWAENSECRPCHAPPGLSLRRGETPAWHRQILQDSFDIFSDNTINKGSGEPIGNSKLCLSCHDGSVAPGAAYHQGLFLNTSAGAVVSFMPMEHPVSVSYGRNIMNKKYKLRDPFTAMSGLGGTIESDLLKNGYIECTSCHDTHLFRNTKGCGSCHQDNNGTYAGRTYSVSLWKSNAKSALCLTCHNM